MPFRELIVVDCCNCERELTTIEANGLSPARYPGETWAATFASHSHASRAATGAGWYIDGTLEFCAECWGFALDWLAQEDDELEEEPPRKFTVTMGPASSGSYTPPPGGFPRGGAAAAAVRVQAREEELVVRRRRLQEAAERMMLGTSDGGYYGDGE